MKSLFKFIISLILIVFILVGTGAAVLYSTYFNVQAAEKYPFLQDESQIRSIEYARFKFSEEGFSPEKIGIIVDTETFISEINNLECHTGIDLNDFKNLIDGQTIDGVIINYADGSFDFINPYLCVNSAFNPTTVSELLSTKIYGFKKDSFDSLTSKCGVLPYIP